MPSERGLSSERGETLLELLIAIAIMMVALAAIVGGLATSIMMSDIHRKQANAGQAVRDYAEAIENYVSTSGYRPCAASSAYAPGTVGFPVPSGYTATVSAASSWNGTSWVACSADAGTQRVTVTVASSDGRATERLDLVLRKPCRTTDAPCS